MYSFLIVKLSAIGDVLQAFPAIDYLSERFPNCTIDWVVDKASAPLIQSHPRIDKAYIADTKKWRKAPFSKEVRSFVQTLRKTTYDALFDLQGNTKSALFTIAASARHKVGPNWSSTPEILAFFATNVHISLDPTLASRDFHLKLLSDYVDEDFKTYSGKVILKDDRPLPDLGQSPRIFVATKARWPNKELRDPLLSAFLQKVEDALSPTFFFPPEEELPLPHLQAIIREMDVVIAVDSALLHLAATTDTPTFSVYGPSSSAIYRPPGENHAAIQGPCPYGQTFVKRCPKLRTCKTGACLSALDPDALFDAFLKFYQTVSPVLMD